MNPKIAETIEELRRDLVPAKEESKAAKARVRSQALFSGAFGCPMTIPEKGEE